MAEFDIFESVKKGVLNTWETRFSLYKKAMPSFIAHATAFYLLGKNVTLVEGPLEPGQQPFVFEEGIELYAGFILLLIGLALLSFVFVYQTRLILIEETELPEKKEERLGVLGYYRQAIVFFVGFLIFKQFYDQIAIHIGTLFKDGNIWMMAFVAIVNVLVSLWLLRFAVAHIPLSIGYPLRDFLKKISGMRFSIYLLGLLVVVFVPISFVSLIVAGLLVNLVMLISGSAVYPIMMILFALSYVVGFLILNSAAVYALDDVMKKQQD